MEANKIEGVDGKNLTKEQLSLIKRTVAKDASNDELAMFMHIAKKQGLDPFLKEIYYYKNSRGGNVIMTSRDGFLKIAQSHPDYAGLASREVREGDKFNIDDINGKVEHNLGLLEREKKQIIGAWAIAHRRRSTPCVVWVDYHEFNKGYSVWKSHPSMMIRKVAEVRALKSAFGIVGLVSEEELGVDLQSEEKNQNAVTELLNETEYFNSILSKMKGKPENEILVACNKMLKTKEWSEEAQRAITEKIIELEKK